MKLAKLTLAIVAVSALTACQQHVPKGPDKGVDLGRDTKDLSQLVAGIWVDPNGCDNWMIDDGFEGYLSARLDKYGKPVCSGAAPANVVTGPWRGGAANQVR